MCSGATRAYRDIKGQTMNSKQRNRRRNGKGNNQQQQVKEIKMQNQHVAQQHQDHMVVQTKENIVAILCGGAWFATILLMAIGLAAGVHFIEAHELLAHWQIEVLHWIDIGLFIADCSGFCWNIGKHWLAQFRGHGH